MHHCSDDHIHHKPTKALFVSLWIACAFMILEIVGGVIANSLALISDAMHLFTDVGAILLSLIALRIARKPSTRKMSYGFHRAEILGALTSALSLWALSAVLVYEAIKRLIVPEEVQGPIVFIIASIGLVANVLMMRTLHSTQWSNINVRAAYLHVIGDLLGSIGVILGGLILWMTKWNPIDPIITIVFTCGILFSSGKIIKQTVRILMESAPDHIDVAAIEADLLAIDGVSEIHDLHVWSVSTHRVALSAHIVATTPHAALNTAHDLLEKKHNIRHMTIQVEDPSHFQPRYCYDCDRDRMPSHPK